MTRISVRALSALALFAAAITFIHETSAAGELPAARAADPPFETAVQPLRWRLVGPFRGGRTRAVTGIPHQPDTFLIGAVNGGVWKTTDSGRTWNPLFDSAATQSIGAIAVAPCLRRA